MKIYVLDLPRQGIIEAEVNIVGLVETSIKMFGQEVQQIQTTLIPKIQLEIYYKCGFLRDFLFVCNYFFEEEKNRTEIFAIYSFLDCKLIMTFGIKLDGVGPVDNRSSTN